MKLTNVLREECIVVGDGHRYLHFLRGYWPDSYAHRAEKSGRNTGGLAESPFSVTASCEYR